MVLHCSKDHADDLLFVPEHPKQPPLSPSLSDPTNRWSPAGLLQTWSANDDDDDDDDDDDEMR